VGPPILAAVWTARIEEAPGVKLEHTESAVALISLNGFGLMVAVEVDGELHQLVETTAEVVGCPGGGTRALSKGRRDARVRDLPAGGRPVVVVAQAPLALGLYTHRLRRGDLDRADRGAPTSHLGRR
jgi:hypothetical protein